MLAICSAVTLVLALLDLSGFVPLREAEFFAQDWRLRLGHRTPMDSRLALIGIDRPSYADNLLDDEVRGEPALAALRGNWPWSRAVWAAVIERLVNAGAKVVAIDLLFAATGAGDDQLRAALEKFPDRVVIGSNFNQAETGRGKDITLAVPPATILAPTNSLPAALDQRVGYVNVWPDFDGVLRRATYRRSNAQADGVLDAPPEAVIESLAARALRKFGAREKIPASMEQQRFRYAAPPGGWRVIPIADVLLPKVWQRNYDDGAFFRDKLVLIGPTAPIFQDRHRTPFTMPASEMLGPEVHLNIINAALYRELLRDAPPATGLLLIALAGFVAALCLGLAQPLGRISALLAANVALLLGTHLLFERANLVLPAIAPLLALNGSGIASLVYDFIIERLERLKLRHTMGLYFSPRVLEAVLADPGSMHPRKADVTLLLTDLRNSTPLAEALGPKGMFKLLNQVFEAQTEAIMSEEGNLEHFLGDQFLSYWGAPQKQADGADRAERAAGKLIRAMENLRATLAPEVQKLFGYGVALHSGPVLVGNKGSAKRLDYGLVGDTVNEAARVEALTKYYGVTLLITRETFAQLTSQNTRRLLDRVIVKGKTEAVELFETQNPLTPTDYAGLCKRYKETYGEYVFGHFDTARQGFERIASEFNDGPSRVLAARCTQLAANPPAEWKGIWRMEAK
ncbi:MAG TPA: adenylate/guanylate cyclase domain-containing protein [Verrucomicrobiae bacterium]